MTRTVWVKADGAVGDWEARKRRVTAAIEAGADWVLVDEGDVGRVRELGDVNVAAFRSDADVIDDAESDAEADAYFVGKGGEGDGTIDMPEDLSGSADLTTLRRRDDRAQGAYVRILGTGYEAFAEAAADDAEFTVIVGEDWSIIPLENLIARVGEETHLVAGATTAAEARTAFETLEIGADGVLLDADSPDEIRGAVQARDAADRETLDLRYAEVTEIEQTGRADRVCIDTGSLMDDSEGMLVGSMSRGLFFVHAETAESPYVASRPFRVNAGAVHAYVRNSEGGTNYLAELSSGDEVQVVDTDGHTREAVVGRVKIEKRPMFRIQAEIETEDGTDRIETLIQNAETVKIATGEGRKAVTEVEPGDEALVYYEDVARHFGEAVEESIIEK
ncbi:3-dehydroquinate synthase II [Halorubrum ezzemoulense]|jgi:3-dehydroquinate synthase II|uniref:3-dehydroquinate synthase n=1 Tax=Halorubrum ezzemoulense TaxID=337243 RepID=A0A481RF45_HALEZ|nr:3-dehydroquinate synthase II [Halorubrum ezzemoulense]MDB2224946.1 3-dehydroquinate synthase II [Halorubrum ezzemoulense]MDB2237179.1 3-dehydroquinate synthase II [Halorubrum ezzemoulense]MDB2246871.1 3-dehydroquinate synthase II [Halorubrum ezzemoulense]MDB2271256.1 3-dehydroquinate synthase II [Halorubrum ezzemoulense]MDB9232647.1 3-dehydroquinate synthase II [Halorubrum ezzemoulense]